MSGSLDEDRVDTQQRFTDRAKHNQRDKTARTAAMRRDGGAVADDIDALPVGRVIQVYSVYCDVVPSHDPAASLLCVIRKTLFKVHGDIVVGDFVRYRPEALSQMTTQAKSPEAVIEQVMPRTTLLTRADSFKAISSHAIVANADNVLIVASIRSPRPKWGLIDRMIIAAQSGGLRPIVCLNKMDLIDGEESSDDASFARAAVSHYRSMEIDTLETSVEHGTGIDDVRSLLRDRITVLAGHSGVGKSSLIRAVQPSLDLRVGAVSTVTDKGRHTTTSAKYYPLDNAPGAVIDTPGVKLFGLWQVTAESLINFFPDVDRGDAPAWRNDSYQRIRESLSR